MNTSWDRFDTLVALRPRTTVEQAWPVTERATLYGRVVALVNETPATPARRRWTRRATIVALLTSTLVPAGVGIAAAGGMLPDFSNYYATWKTNVGVDPATAIRAATAPGPDGTIFSVWTAKGPNGRQCFAPLFETPQSAASPDISAFDGSGSSCAPIGQKQPFGGSRAVDGDNKNATYEVSAGATTRASLKLPDGTVRPAVRVADRYFGWYSTTGGGSAVLTAYDAGGAVAGAVELTLPIGPR